MVNGTRNLCLVVFLGASAVATADDVNVLGCNFAVCDQIRLAEANPVLVGISPLPLPRKAFDAPQPLTLTWTLPNAIAHNPYQFSACLTQDPNPVARDTDGCALLQNTLVPPGGEEAQSGITFESDVELPFSIRQPDAYLYVRAASGWSGGGFQGAVSNMFRVTWPIDAPDLETHSVEVEWDIFAQEAVLEHGVSNVGTKVAGSFEVRFLIHVCGTVLGDSCDPDVPPPLGMFIETIELSHTYEDAIEPGDRVDIALDVTQLLPEDPPTIFVTTEAFVDDTDQVRELDEVSNNYDSGTRVLVR